MFLKLYYNTNTNFITNAVRFLKKRRSNFLTIMTALKLYKLISIALMVHDEFGAVGRKISSKNYEYKHL